MSWVEGTSSCRRPCCDVVGGGGAVAKIGDVRDVWMVSKSWLKRLSRRSSKRPRRASKAWTEVAEAKGLPLRERESVSVGGLGGGEEDLERRTEGVCTLRGGRGADVGICCLRHAAHVLVGLPLIPTK